MIIYIIFNLILIFFHRISFCTCDIENKRIVAIVSTNPNGSFECHAFKLDDHKVAHLAAFAISRAFNKAFENWTELSQHCETSSKEDAEIARLFMANRSSLASAQALLEKEVIKEVANMENIVETGDKIRTTYPALANGNLTLLDLDNDELFKANTMTTTTTIATTVDIRFLLPSPFAKPRNFLIDFDEP